MKKVILIVSFLFVGAQAQAEGLCRPKQGESTKMCDGKSKNACDFYSDVCEWKDSNEITVKVKVENSEKSKSCTAKEGKEAHESFCEDHNKQVCKVHSSLCEWK